MYHKGHPRGNNTADCRDHDQKVCPKPEKNQQWVCTAIFEHKINVHALVDVLMWPHTIDGEANERDSKDETEDNSERLLDSDSACDLREGKEFWRGLRSARGTL